MITVSASTGEDPTRSPGAGADLIGAQATAALLAGIPQQDLMELLDVSSREPAAFGATIDARLVG